MLAYWPAMPWKIPTRSTLDRKSTRLNSGHSQISYAVFCLQKNTYDLQSQSNPVCRLLLDKNLTIPVSPAADPNTLPPAKSAPPAALNPHPHPAIAARTARG